MSSDLCSLLLWTFTKPCHCHKLFLKIVSHPQKFELRKVFHHECRPNSFGQHRWADSFMSATESDERSKNQLRQTPKHSIFLKKRNYFCVSLNHNNDWKGFFVRFAELIHCFWTVLLEAFRFQSNSTTLILECIIKNESVIGCWALRRNWSVLEVVWCCPLDTFLTWKNFVLIFPSIQKWLENSISCEILIVGWNKVQDSSSKDNVQLKLVQSKVYFR